MFHSHTRLPTVINGTVYSEDNYNNVFQSRTRSSQGPLPVTPSTRSSDRLSALPVSISLSVLDLLYLSIDNFTSIPLSLYNLFLASDCILWPSRSREYGREEKHFQKLIFLENLHIYFYLYLLIHGESFDVNRWEELIIFLISYVDVDAIYA